MSHGSAIANTPVVERGIREDGAPRRRACGRCARCRSAGASCRSPRSISRWRSIFTAVIWNGAQVLTSARNDLRETRESDRLLALLESQAGRLQSLIHRYFTQPNADLLQEITELRKSLLGTLKNRASSIRSCPARPPSWCRRRSGSSPASASCATCRTPSATPTRTRC